MTDALLILSFGGPEGPEDVLPFLRNVTKGRNVPDERLAAVAEQYELFGGRSPINDQCRALKSAIEADFATNGLDLPVYWGNRNWQPFLTDTVATMAADGVTRAQVFVTSAFGSYSGCRQYRENLAAAADAVGPGAPTFDKLRLYFNHPGFIEPMADNVLAALKEIRVDGEEVPRLVFTAHSIPTVMAGGCDYEAQLRDAAQLVVAATWPDGSDTIEWDLVFQSRSGPPSVPWLEPDINDHLATLATDGVDRVVLVPLGFVSDHMEVLFDLDTQAAQTADQLGITLTPGRHCRRRPAVRRHGSRPRRRAARRCHPRGPRPPRPLARRLPARPLPSPTPPPNLTRAAGELGQRGPQANSATVWR